MNQKSKKIRGDVDRLSELDDNILNLILTLVGPKQAAKTTVLSKRWKNLFNNLPCLTFQAHHPENDNQLMARITRTLRQRNVSLQLHALLVRFVYEKRFAPAVDAWFELALQRRVKRLHLKLFPRNNDLYKLPSSTYSCTSFTSIYLQHCIVALEPRATIRWVHLTDLTICSVKLQECVIQKILSGCPVLRNLRLKACFGFERLDINNPQSLRNLSVEDDGDTKEGSLQISAPHVLDLSIRSPFTMTKRKVRLANIHSVVKTDVVFSAFEFGVLDGEMITETIQFFEEIRHVKALSLRCNSEQRSFGCLCLEVIFRLARNGLRLPISDRVCLTVDAWRDENSFSGILALLESSPFLEKLTIQCHDSSFEDDEAPWGPVARDDLDSDLPSLRSVQLLNYGNPKLGGEPLLTMARILLKRAPALTEMVVEAMGSFVDDEDDEDSSSVANKVSQELHSYPRSSQHVYMDVQL